MSSYDLTPEPAPTAKPWFKSKMIWVNGITLMAGVVGYVAGHTLIADNAALIAGLIAFQGLLNTVLRFVTWEKIG